MKNYNRSNIVLLTLLFLLMVWVFYFDISNQAILTINDLLIIALFVFNLRLLLYKSTFGQYPLFFLIVFAVAGVVKLTYTIGNTTYSSHYTFHAGRISFDPLSFLLLLFFILINRRSIFELIYGSEEERNSKRDKLIQFYYDKFSESSVEELSTVLKVFNDYPIEAQEALKKIHQEKGLSLIK